MRLPDFNTHYWFLYLVLLFFILITGRYFLVAGLFYFVFFIWFPSRWEQRKIHKNKYPPGQFKTEIKWSIITTLIFSITGAITVMLWQNGYTKVYIVYNQYGWLYLPFSLVLFMLLHETYYYWIHRWMHIPSIYKRIHKIHHDSRISSPFTAFSFHPGEGLLQAFFLPIMLMLIPMHYSIIIILLIIMTFSSVINHLDIEVYPAKSQHFLAKWLIGATYHSLHHKQFKYNYGLYFTFWDRIKKTESPRFKELYKTLTQSK